LLVVHQSTAALAGLFVRLQVPARGTLRRHRALRVVSLLRDSSVDMVLDVAPRIVRGSYFGRQPDQEGALSCRDPADRDRARQHGALLLRPPHPYTVPDL